MELNKTGKAIKRAIIQYLKDIDEHYKVEETIIINSTAKCYELYEKYLDQAEAEMSFNEDDSVLGLKLHALSSKQYVNYITNLKSLGISATQRVKLKPVEEPVDAEENSIIKEIQEAKKSFVTCLSCQTVEA